MNYLLLLFDDEKRWQTMPEPELREQYGAYTAYTEALRAAGVYVDGNPLQPTSTATTVRVSADGKATVLDGPYIETKEQLGGYYEIDVPDLDAALSWAARCPGAKNGVVEVRPIMQLSVAT